MKAKKAQLGTVFLIVFIDLIGFLALGFMP